LIEGKVAELSERLVTRETETIDALSTAAILEVDLKASLKECDFSTFFSSLELNFLSRNIAHKANWDAHASELQELRSLKEE
jgi:hypothetical protein